MDRRELLGGLAALGASAKGGIAIGTGPATPLDASTRLDLSRDRTDITDAFLAASRRSGELRLRTGVRYLTRGGIVTNFPLRIFGSGVIEVATPGRSVIHFTGRKAPIRGIVIEDVVFAEPHFPQLGGGLNNDHSCLRLGGVEGALLKNLKFQGLGTVGPDICFHVGFGEVTMPDRGSTGVVATNIKGVGVRAMGFEMFGSRHGQFANLSFAGTGPGGRAIMHGVRMTAFDFAHNLNNAVSAQVSSFETGCSLQRFSRKNTCAIDATDCRIGMHVHGAEEDRDASNVCRDNSVRLVASGCDIALYDGGSYNSFTVDATDCKDSGIIGKGGRPADGLGVGNRYAGSIRGFRHYGADLAGDHNEIDLAIFGSGMSQSSVGLRSTGRELRGSISVSDVRDGIRLQGHGARINAIAANCARSLILSGDDNEIDCNLDGDVIITGNGNRLRGLIRGHITNAGKDNAIDARVIGA
jgi:hypothetical protein